jgi:putative transposase
MARLPRLALAGHSHLVLQRAHGALAGSGGPVAQGAPAGPTPLFADEADRRTYRAALFEAAAAEGVAVHAWALCDTEVLLLLTPATATGLSRLMQSLGRRYVSAHHRRHGGSGTLWDGRFRAALVESGPTRLAALRWVDGAAGGPSALARPSMDGQPLDAAPRTSASQRLGARREPGLQDPPELWPLGNTPFEREAAYRALLAEGLPPAQAAAMRHATWGGWAVGSATFAAQVEDALARPAKPRPRGRPRTSAASATAAPTGSPRRPRSA